MVGRESGRGEEGATTADAVVDVGSEGVEDDADEGSEVVDKGQRDTDVRVGMDEVRCAVDWVADECRGCSEIHAGLVRLFAEESGGG